MDKRKARILFRIGDGAGVGAEPEEAEGWWERSKGNCTGKGENDYGDYAPPNPDSEAAVASSDSELVIMFKFLGQEDVATMVGYAKLAFTVFS